MSYDESIWRTSPLHHTIHASRRLIGLK